MVIEVPPKKSVVVLRMKCCHDGCKEFPTHMPREKIGSGRFKNYPELAACAHHARIYSARLCAHLIDERLSSGNGAVPVIQVIMVPPPLEEIPAIQGGSTSVRS